jgi:putative zinc finger/helix-turn-helix YgiT family protein
MTEHQEGTSAVCPSCGGAHVTTIRAISEQAQGTVTLRFEDEYSRCERCKDEFYTFEQSRAHSLALTAAKREVFDLPTGEQIRAARRKLGLTQEEFEEALCLGKKTLGRWERGTVPPSGPANLAIWLAERHPGVFMEFARTRGVAERATPVTASNVSVEVLEAERPGECVLRVRFA